MSGNSKTFMLGALSPATSAYDENLVTLRLASTVKNVQMKVSKVVSGDKSETVKTMQEGIARLKEQLNEADSQTARSTTSPRGLRWTRTSPSVFRDFVGQGLRRFGTHR